MENEYSNMIKHKEENMAASLTYSFPISTSEISTINDFARNQNYPINFIKTQTISTSTSTL